MLLLVSLCWHHNIESTFCDSEKAFSGNSNFFQSNRCHPPTSCGVPKHKSVSTKYYIPNRKPVNTNLIGLHIHILAYEVEVGDFVTKLTNAPMFKLLEWFPVYYYGSNFSKICFLITRIAYLWDYVCVTTVTVVAWA